MAKRGRKPGRARTGYWYEEQDAAFREFLTTDDINRKEELYNTILKPAFTKLVESIIRRYNLYVPNEPFEDTFNDTLSFIMSKIEHFNPNSGFKSFSYVGTICKNYLIYKINTADKLKKRNTSYDGFNNEEMSMQDWLKRMTGWKSVETYKFAIHKATGKSLSEIRKEYMDENME